MRMSRKNIIFDDKKISKSIVYKNDYIEVSNIFISKKEPYGKKAHSNTSLDIMMIMMSLVLFQIFWNKCCGMLFY